MNIFLKKISNNLSSKNRLKLALIKKAEENSIDGRDLGSLLEEFSDKGFVQCKNYNEYIAMTEFLYLHDQSFKVTGINSNNNVCKIWRL